MKLAPEGYPFIITPFLLALAAMAAAFWIRKSGSGLFFQFLAYSPVILLVVGFFMLFFFRDPDRRVPTGSGLFVSAADGKVLGVREVYEEEFLKTKVKKLSVFMSPLDVHVNRAPCSGRVVAVKYTPGTFLKAFTEDASIKNENIAMVIDGEHGRVMARQVAGILARRAVCRVKVGDTLDRGERYGMIKFSSRLDLFLPMNAEIRVKTGDKVKAGETVVAVIK